MLLLGAANAYALCAETYGVCTRARTGLATATRNSPPEPRRTKKRIPGPR
jgi:hypothetical protein